MRDHYNKYSHQKYAHDLSSSTSSAVKLQQPEHQSQARKDDREKVHTFSNNSLYVTSDFPSLMNKNSQQPPLHHQNLKTIEPLSDSTNFQNY